jgi:hypothetical protein
LVVRDGCNEGLGLFDLPAARIALHTVLYTSTM